MKYVLLAFLVVGTITVFVLGALIVGHLIIELLKSFLD